jgi:hypothetical protein
LPKACGCGSANVPIFVDKRFYKKRNCTFFAAISKGCGCFRPDSWIVAFQLPNQRLNHKPPSLFGSLRRQSCCSLMHQHKTLSTVWNTITLIDRLPVSCANLTEQCISSETTKHWQVVRATGDVKCK